jgi:hypothetical protein
MGSGCSRPEEPTEGGEDLYEQSEGGPRDRKDKDKACLSKKIEGAEKSIRSETNKESASLKCNLKQAQAR